jgi:hypothetical protein
MSSSQDLGSDTDDDLDLEMFEVGTDNKNKQDSDSDMNEQQDDEAFEKFHSILQNKKRNSITQILNKSNRKKSPAPKSPKPVGYRMRPKLDEVSWKTVDIEDGDYNTSYGTSETRKESKEENTPSNFILAKSDSTDMETAAENASFWSKSKAVHDSEETLDNTSLSGDGTSSEAGACFFIFACLCMFLSHMYCKFSAPHFYPYLNT